MTNIFDKLKYCKYSIFGCSFFYSYSDIDNLLSNPPVGKLIFYEAAKKGLLPNVYYQFKLWLLNDFFVGTTVGFDSKKYSYKYFEIGTGSVRLDILNSIFDIILYSTKSDVTEYKYGLLYKDSGFKGLLQSSIATNLIISSVFIKVLFFKINIGELSVGNLLSYLLTSFGALGDNLKTNDDKKFEKLLNISRNTFLVSVFVPSIQIDIIKLIDFIKTRKMPTFINTENISNVDDDSIN